MVAVVVVEQVGLDFVYLLPLELELVLSTSESEQLPNLGRVVLLSVEVESKSVLKGVQILRLLGDKILHIGQDGIVVPEGHRQVVHRQLLWNVSLFALLDLQDEELFGYLNLHQRTLDKQELLDGLHVDEYLALVVQPCQVILLLIEPELLLFQRTDQVKSSGSHLTEYVGSPLGSHETVESSSPRDVVRVVYFSSYGTAVAVLHFEEVA